VSKLMLRKRKIETWMLLIRRNQDSILIMNKFNLHNFKYLMWVFGQILIINIPLLDIEIGHKYNLYDIATLLWWT
jgi:hypothetical protein